MKNCKLRAQRSKWHCKQTTFNWNSKELKKGPLRGTPHNLSKVSLEVRELKIIGKTHYYKQTIPN